MIKIRIADNKFIYLTLTAPILCQLMPKSSVNFNEPKSTAFEV